jgi:demethoxyubiquinone hydroxylase (CLK1/Coq7/Cat5 family)
VQVQLVRCRLLKVEVRTRIVRTSRSTFLTAPYRGRKSKRFLLSQEEISHREEAGPGVARVAHVLDRVRQQVHEPGAVGIYMGVIYVREKEAKSQDIALLQAEEDEHLNNKETRAEVQDKKEEEESGGRGRECVPAASPEHDPSR